VSGGNGKAGGLRADLTIIAGMVRPGSRVLDLGCGDGTLMKALARERGVRGYGIEIDDANVLAALINGVNVLQGNLERGLASFADGSFDTVLLSQTLQAMHGIEALLQDMVRVGREAVVSFPNFRYAPHFRQLEAGHMPVSDSLPHQWHNTPNVHLCTLADFEDLCGKLGLDIVERVALAEGRPVHAEPNVNGELAIYRIRSGA
jgi:methionine biosynthesis protein MetW